MPPSCAPALRLRGERMGLAPERCSRVACRYRSENLQDGFLYRGDVVAVTALTETGLDQRRSVKPLIDPTQFLRIP